MISQVNAKELQAIAEAVMELGNQQENFGTFAFALGGRAMQVLVDIQLGEDAERLTTAECEDLSTRFEAETGEKLNYYGE